MSVSATFVNPLVAGADPWVVRHGDAYLYCHAGPDNTLCVRRASRLHAIGSAAPATIWRAPASGPCSRELWAPELHFVAGRWYVYFAADDGDNARHRMWALVAQSEDPQGTFTLAGKLALSPERWAIDGTLFSHAGRLYFAWSGWEGFENVAQHLYICPMRDPLTPAGERVRISSPTLDWEQRGSGGPGNLPTINEGPQALQKGGNTHLIYSAAGSWSDDYCLGRLTLAPGGDPLDPSAWRKAPAPVFARTEAVCGPGHASFVTDRADQDWIVYHAARYAGAGWDRDVRLQPFSWEGAQPVFGAPVAPGTPLLIPDGSFI